MGLLLIVWPQSQANQIRRARTNKSSRFAPLFGDAIYAPPLETAGFCDDSFLHPEHNLNLMLRNR
jgi:hypothetical protein